MAAKGKRVWAGSGATGMEEADMKGGSGARGDRGWERQAVGGGRKSGSQGGCG